MVSKLNIRFHCRLVVHITVLSFVKFHRASRDNYKLGNGMVYYDSKAKEHTGILGKNKLHELRGVFR